MAALFRHDIRGIPPDMSASLLSQAFYVADRLPVALLRVDSAGIIDYANDYAQTYLASRLDGSELLTVSALHSTLTLTEWHRLLRLASQGPVTLPRGGLLYRHEDSTGLYGIIIIEEEQGMSEESVSNNDFFVRQVETRRRRKGDSDHPVAVIILALDQFDLILRSAGADMAKEAILDIRRRLLELLPPDPLFVRIADDCFAIALFGHHARSIEIELLTQHMLRSTSGYLPGNEADLRITCSIGISLPATPPMEASLMLELASAALDDARLEGGNRSRVYSRHHANSATTYCHRHELAVALMQAQINLRYLQRQDSATGLIVGVEAIPQWQHAHLGDVPPGPLLTLAEQTDLGWQLGRYLLERASDQLHRWQRTSLAGIHLCLPLPLSCLCNPALPSLLLELRAQFRIGPHKLQSLIPESFLKDDPDLRSRCLRRLHRAGLGLVLDDPDFAIHTAGTLSSPPFDIIKLSPGCVREIGMNENGPGIARVIVALARRRRMKVLAEGVDSHAQIAILTDSGCHLIQGTSPSALCSAEELHELHHTARKFLETAEHRALSDQDNLRSEWP
jgi:EAL domain-containing protein (putative c-di-GMP-specific phosphodiesterase class I)/GGDEF domain-containing protein